ncbi:LMBR1-like membrane protein-domain-containing protein [Cokeromyces recurvatus]|uniref:LMBR1-like membrane protein-domain-containing protein n=1 Tax=Cokeromyces recurvatus TaxID=90255 RepID=UPI00221F70D8|nr:LMBR1-like membrane protein-domain-containing protein [Cokeromyces recurvatus]KAI7900314.1 LMBR1-like membrane protein-domain-containing protein [Cokeromyces recurvatus]
MDSESSTFIETPPITTIQHSDWLPLVAATLLSFIIVLLTLSRYGSIRSQPWYVTATCMIGWFFPFWIIFLLPLDLASTVHDDKKGRVPFAYVSQSFLFVAWRVLYWTSFCLTWFIIPMMQAYINQGDFSISKRLKSAIHVNIRFYSIYVVVGAIGLIYLIFGNGLTTREGIQSYVMAAANSWGLFLVIILMGYGLVSVPRTLWYSANYNRHLNKIYAKAARLKEECMDSELEFNELAKTMNEISKRATMELPEIQQCIHIMNSRFPFVFHESFSSRNNSVHIPRDLTEDYLVKLSRRMILAIRMRNRKNALWKNLLNEAFYLEDIINNKDKRNRKFTSTLRAKKEDTQWNRMVSSIEWWWKLRILPNINKLLAILFSIISICIIWSELVFNVRRPAIISIIYYAVNACGENYAALEAMAFFILLYMCFSVYSSLFKIRFFNLYLLIPNHHTDENSLLWFTSYMCKMMAPLCYNFINLAVDAPGINKAVFTTFMGKADLIKFLGAFADWFPIIILIPSLSLLFNIQNRFLGLCGIKSPYQNNDQSYIYNDDDNNDTEANNSNRILDEDFQEGMKLIKEERELREREINPELGNNSNREYINKKYSKKSAFTSDTLRNKRDRRIDEILSGRINKNQYSDNSILSPSSSTSTENVTNNQSETESLKLKSNLISFGDSVKHKIGGLFDSFKGNNENTATTFTPVVVAPSQIEEEEEEEQTKSRLEYTLNHVPTTVRGRVFGRPVINENYRPFKNTRHHLINNEEQEEDNNTTVTNRLDSPNPFLMASSNMNHQTNNNGYNNNNNNNNSVSPFARFDGV